MPETVNGYELFALPCSRESGKGKRYATYRNKLGFDGVRSHVLYGADTGLARFSIPYDVLAAGSSSVTMGGVTMTHAKYIRDLHDRWSVSGVPFVIQDRENNDQYYLVEFEDDELTLTKKLAGTYSTSITLVQVRIPGVTVFDPTKMSGLWGWYKEDSPDVDRSGSSHDLNITGNVVDDGGTVQNGLKTARLNGGATNTGFLNTTFDPVIKEAFFIMKMNEATFSNYAGILTADLFTAALVGDGSGGKTTFNNFAFGSTYEYRKNGIPYTEINQQAPMNVFGLVHIRYQTGWLLTNMEIGKDRDFAGRFAELDLGETLLFTTLNPLSDSLELAEHLQTRWAI